MGLFVAFANAHSHSVFWAQSNQRIRLHLEAIFHGKTKLAIEVDESNIINRLVEIEEYDWKHSIPLDLSDKGLYEDLENRGAGGSEKLVLDLSKKKNKE